MKNSGKNCPNCGLINPQTAQVCDCGYKFIGVNRGGGRMKNRFPGVLWLLPICFGIFGGTIAAFIASMKYQASWWELFVAGLIVSIGCYVLLILFAFTGFNFLG